MKFLIMNLLSATRHNKNTATLVKIRPNTTPSVENLPKPDLLQIGKAHLLDNRDHRKLDEGQGMAPP